MTFVVAGLAKLDETGTANEAFASTRQSRFIKDCEMAEVLTEQQDQAVVEMLSQYVLDRVAQHEEPPPKKKRRRRKKY